MTWSQPTDRLANWGELGKAGVNLEMETRSAARGRQSGGLFSTPRLGLLDSLITSPPHPTVPSLFLFCTRIGGNLHSSCPAIYPDSQHLKRVYPPDNQPTVSMADAAAAAAAATKATPTPPKFTRCRTGCLRCRTRRRKCEFVSHFFLSFLSRHLPTTTILMEA